MLGGCKEWNGVSLNESHQKLRIKEKEFNIYYRQMVEILKSSKINIRIS